MNDFLNKLFDTSDFPARWHCGQWTSFHGWLHIVSDLAIFGAYMAIPLILVLFTRRRRDLPKPFPSIFWLFGTFIIACGFTHLNEAIIFWTPIYRLAGLVKLGTAVVSWLTLVFLVPSIPKALALKSPAKLEQEVQKATDELRRERDSAAHLAAIVNSSHDAIIGKDLDNAIQSWNPGAERMFGYPAHEIVGRNISILVPPDSKKGAASTPVVEQGHRTASYEGERLRKDGSMVPVSLTVSPYYNQAGALCGASVIARDITARRRAEEQLRLKKEELERSNAELEQFAYVASHDLQEPLRMVIAYMGMLERDYRRSLDEKALKCIDFAVDGASRMKQMVDDLLQYSRIDSRGSPFQDVPVGTVLAQVLKNLGLLVQETGARVMYTDLPTVWGDALQLEQVFQNLLSNAIKFRADRPPEIRVGYRDRGRKWEFVVEDNGIGFDPIQAERIFQMFQRLHERARFEGNGIGLALVKRIVLRHGGEIWADPTPGQGAKFHFTLPRGPDTGIAFNQIG